jgi:hypothetical protein
MVTEHDAFKHRKSNWKRETKRVLEVVSRMFEDVYYGRRPNMHDIWDYAHKLVSLGTVAIALNEQAGRLKKSDRVFVDIARGANKIESASKHLKQVTTAVGMPEDIPVFASPLVHKAAEERTTLEDVLKTEDKPNE